MEILHSELIDLELDDFYSQLKIKGLIKSKKDLKIFILESISNLQKDPTTDFPIHYYDEDIKEDIKEEEKFIEHEALTNDLIERIKVAPAELEDALTFEEYINQESEK